MITIMYRNNSAIFFSTYSNTFSTPELQSFLPAPCIKSPGMQAHKIASILVTTGNCYNYYCLTFVTLYRKHKVCESQTSRSGPTAVARATMYQSLAVAKKIAALGTRMICDIRKKNKPIFKLRYSFGIPKKQGFCLLENKNFLKCFLKISLFSYNT